MGADGGVWGFRGDGDGDGDGGGDVAFVAGVVETVGGGLVLG